MIARILAALMLAGGLAALGGCNTVDGIGKDLGRAGEATSETARDVRKSM